jgi:hypothetical protein
MGKIFKISLIPAAILLSFYNLSFGDELGKGISPTNSSSELIYGPWILPQDQKGEALFPSPDKAEFAGFLYGGKPNKTIGNREFSMNPEITNTPASTVTTEYSKEEMPDFENRQLSRGKSSYRFGKIHLIKNTLDHSLSFIPSLSAVPYKEENPLSWAPEKIRESDIYRSLAIFLELKFNF